MEQNILSCILQLDVLDLGKSELKYRGYGEEETKYSKDYRDFNDLFEKWPREWHRYEPNLSP